MFFPCSSFPNDFKPPPFPFSSVPPPTSPLPTRVPPSACPVAAGPEAGALRWQLEAILTRPRPPDRRWGWGSRRCSSPPLALGAFSHTGPCTPPRTSPCHHLNLGERHGSCGAFPAPSETNRHPPRTETFGGSPEGLNPLPLSPGGTPTVAWPCTLQPREGLACGKGPDLWLEGRASPHLHEEEVQRPRLQQGGWSLSCS